MRNRKARTIGILGGVVLAVLAVLAATGIVSGAAPSRASAVSSPADGATRGGDDYRTGWYPDQANLTPGLVTGGTFGQLFKTAVNGSVYGQPLLDDGQILVNTENNYSYGLNPVTGAILWSRHYGTPALASQLGCADLAPNMGITSTPVVDQATDVEYLVDNEYVSGSSGPQAYYMHALNLDAHGAEEPGFPVEIKGTATNDPQETFNATYEIQRPGLLLLGGVVYAGFAGHCDFPPYQGYIAGVSEAGKLTTLWSDETQSVVSGTTPQGGGIWQSGGGLVSDGPGTILITTGNGGCYGCTPNGTIPGDTPPVDLGESVVRLDVQPDGSLKPVDFFAPYDAPALDTNDLDFGSGSPVALPDQYFGTASTPHLLIAVGKEGYVYLLNRDNLGGEGEGPSGTDNIVGRFGPNGGVWSSPAVWPGNGGWIYIPTAAGGAAQHGSAGVMDAYQYGLTASGTPTLNLAGQSSDAFGFGSSAPVVTSNGTTSGSALMWTVWSPDGTGVGAQLRAYDPVPVDGTLKMVFSAPVGTSSKFNPPGVGGNRIYVGTRDGYVIGFGAPVSAPVTAASPTFPATVVGQSSTETLTVTANSNITITGLSVSSGRFSLGTPSPSLPADLGSGSSLTVPVTFTPTVGGLAGGSVTITTQDSGTSQVPLSATGEVNGPSLDVTTNGISFGGIPPGQQASQGVGFFNDGSSALTVSNVHEPGAPFATSGAPVGGDTIAPGAEVFVNVTFSPSKVGLYTDTLEVDSDGGDQIVTLTGKSTAPSVLKITPMTVNFGKVTVGHSVTEKFRLTDVGGSSLTFSKSKPPDKGEFTALTTLPEGTTMAAGSSLVESVRFTPKAVGHATGGWILNANDNRGVRTVAFTGYGVAPPPPPPPPTCKSTNPSNTSGISPTVGIASSPDGGGYLTAQANGNIDTFGNALFCGSMAGVPLNEPIDHIVATPDGKGYWLVASDGGTFAFGDAPFYGSMGGQQLNAPIVDIAPTPDGHGYWLVASDGGIFAFGDAGFYGSTGAIHLNQPVVGMASTPSGKGYWLVASDGGIFAFGDAGFYGSLGAIHLNEPIVGMAATPDGHGYWMVASDGGIFNGGDAGLLRIVGRHPPQCTHRGHRKHSRRPWVLAGRSGRRDIQLW